MSSHFAPQQPQDQQFNQPVNQFQTQQFNQPKPKSAAAIVALVLGIVGLVSSWVPILNNLSFFLALIGLVFGIVGLVGTIRGKKSGKGLAIASLLICVIACAIVLATQSAYSAAINKSTKSVVSSSNTSSTSTSTTGAAASSGDAEKYTIEDEEFVEDTYNCKITGIYTNKSGAKQSYVQVSYTLFDADGNQIGTAFANTNNLEDGGTWKFEASTLKNADEIASWKFSEVSAF